MKDPRVTPFGDGQAVREWWRSMRIGAAASAGTPDGRLFKSIGKDSYLAFPQGVLMGLEHVSIGSRCVINEFATIAAQPLEVTSGFPVVEIGDDVTLGRRCEIVGHHQIRIGDGTQFGPDCYITDANHTNKNPQLWIGDQPMHARPVSIGSGCSFGAGSKILPGACIGANTQVAAGAVVARGTYPAHCLLVGVPARPRVTS